jgi:uncharacterized protein DUF3800
MEAKYGFMDEAGDVGADPGSSRVMVVAVVLTGSPELLRREIKKVRTRLGKKKERLQEFKASESPPAWNRKRLERLAALDSEIVVVAAEKTLRSFLQKPEVLYQTLCIQAVEECLQYSPTLNLCVDKRYTNPRLREDFDQALQSAIEQSGRTLIIKHLDSVQEAALQQADLLAWAFLQKYTKGDESFTEPIKRRIVAEKVLTGW